MPDPDFIIIGAPRCGTSVFYRLLCRHPKIKYVPKKEIHFFDWNHERGLEWYLSQFGHVPEERIVGEATPRYLAHPEVPERMVRVLPDVKLIVLLRNPVDRAYSHYHLLRRRGLEEEFEAVLETERGWLEENSLEDPSAPTNLLTTGIYVEHLKRWHRHYPREQLLVLKSEDFYARPRRALSTTREFLGLPEHRFNLRIRRARHEYAPMNPETRKELVRFFRPYNEELYDYLGRSFGWEESEEAA